MRRLGLASRANPTVSAHPSSQQKASTFQRTFGVILTTTTTAYWPLVNGRAARVKMAQMPKFPKAAERKKAHVLIVDDQPIVRERLAQLVDGEAGLTAYRDTDDRRRAFEIIAAKQPDLVVTGLSLTDGHGLEFIKDLKARYPTIPVLVFSMYDESLYAERAIRAGASGFISKNEPTSEVVRAIRRVLIGEMYLSEVVQAQSVRRFFARSPLDPGSELSRLSDRELQVIELIGRGRSSRQIATTLHLDVKTIETYRARIKVKLALATSTQLVERAQESLQDLRPRHTRRQATL